jgi:phospho-N-acetylmuramoyl-pentapeptide-transferase
MQSMIWAVIAAFAVALALGPIVIPILHRLKFGQMTREEGPKSHQVKSGTPTIGGIIFLAAAFAATLLFARDIFSNELLLAVLLTTLGYGLIGFLDDFIKVAKKRNLGLKAYQKFAGQMGIAIVLAIFCYQSPYVGSSVWVPFANTEWDLGIFYIPFAIFVIVATVNSANLSDGLDGLLSGMSLIILVTLGIILYYGAEAMAANGATLLAENLHGVAIFAAGLAGGCLGFLRVNTYPAKVFMGDTGSLALGGAIVSIMLVFKIPLLLPICCGLLMMSTISVILQVASFKLRGKRIFKMAPLHHHFEMCGMPETRVVSMYMIFTAVLCLLTLLIVSL